MNNEHRRQLRDKVEARRTQLGAALTTAEGEGHSAERVLGLVTELQVVADALTGGWDRMSEVTAAQLTRWLEATRFLVEDAPAPRARKPAPRPEPLELDRARAALSGDEPAKY